MRWEYTYLRVDTWLDVGSQSDVKEELARLGASGWEAFAVTPPTPPVGDGDDPDASTYEILLKRPLPDA